MRWVQVGLLGLVVWLTLTLAFGAIWGFVGLPYVREASNLQNFVFLPLGVWIAHRVVSRGKTGH